MRTKQRNLGLTLLSLVMAIALVFGFTSMANSVKADDLAPTVSMENGARIRVEEGAPALIYTAVIENYDENSEYGMLLVEKSLLSGVTDYVAELDAQDYQKVECAPYGTETKKIKAYFDIASDKLSVEYAGIAYVYDGTAYTYSAVSENNVRSVEYVAQMAYLRGDGDKDVLASFISCELTDDMYGVRSDYVSNEATIKEANKYLSLVVDNLNEGIQSYDGSTELSFITEDAYAPGSVISFDIYVPAEVASNYWLKIGYTTDSSDFDFYADAGNLQVDGQGVWSTVTAQIPNDASETCYFYITANKGSLNDETGLWTGSFNNNGTAETVVHYALRFDNFVVTEPDGDVYTQDFENGYNGGDIDSVVNFDVNGNPSKGIAPEDVAKVVEFGGSFTLGGEAPELAMKYTFNIGMDEKVAFVSKQAYESGTELTFYYFIPEGTITSWWRVAFGTTQEIDYYSDVYRDLTKVCGEWTEVTITVPDGGPYYVSITSEVGTSGGRWMLDGENAHVLIDDFTVDGEVVEDFNHGVENSIFKVLNAVVVSDSVPGEGYIAPEEPENPELDMSKVAMKYTLGVTDLLGMITSDAYAGGSTLEFKWKLEGARTDGWWGVAWNTDPSTANNYNAAGIETGYFAHQGLPTTAGEWQTATVTLTGTDSYYIYFGFSYNGWEEGSYFLIDDIKINGELVEDFSNGLEESIFDVKQPSAVGLGVVKGFVEANYSLKYTMNIADTIAMSTKKSYPAGTVVNFKYFIPAGTTTSWWGWSVSAVVSNDNYYDTASNGVGNATGVWTNATFTTASEGYIFFGFEVGHWSQNSYVLFDEFTIGEDSDNFDKGFNHADALFNVDSAIISLGEGYVYTAPEYGVHFLPGDLSSNVSTPSFITTSTYAGGGTVTLDYYIDGTIDSTDDWWGLCWTTSNTSANIFAIEGNPDASTATNDGKKISTAVTGQWQTVTIDIPEGTWYFYLAGNRYQWANATITIDNVIIKDANGEVLATEGFNGDDYGIFAQNRGSISKVQGRVEEDDSQQPPVEPDIPEEVVVTFESLIADGTIYEYLYDEDRVMWATHFDLSDNTLTAGELVLSLGFDLSYNGERSFVLVLDMYSFLYFDGENVSFYQNGALVSVIENVGERVDIGVMANGTLNVNVNGEYVAVGALSVSVEDGFGTVGFVSLFGEGTFTVTNLKISTFNAPTVA